MEINNEVGVKKTLKMPKQCHASTLTCPDRHAVGCCATLNLMTSWALQFKLDKAKKS